MQANLLELSKQGNADAIAALMNRHLQAKGIFARVLLQKNCLKVMLDSSEVPDQKSLAPFVLKGISSLNIPSVQTIQVYGRKCGEKAPVWTQTFNQTFNQTNPELGKPPSSTSSKTTAVVQPLAVDSKLPTQEPETTTPEKQDALEKQSNQLALENHLNQFVSDEAITIEVERQGTLLKVIAKTDKFLEGPSFAKGIYQELLRLDLEHVKTVEIYKQKRKGSYSFCIQSFVLVKDDAPAVSSGAPATAAAKPDLQANKAAQTVRSPQAPSVKNSSPAPKHSGKKKENINGIRRKLTVVFVAIVAGFVIIRLIGRLAWAFSSPIGWFSIAIALFSIWRAWSFLDPLLQQLLRDE